MMQYNNSWFQMRWDSQTQPMLGILLASSLLLAFFLLGPYAGYFRSFGRGLRLMLAGLVLGDAIMVSQFARWTRSIGPYGYDHGVAPILVLLTTFLTVVCTMPLAINLLDQIEGLRSGDAIAASGTPGAAPERGRPWLSGWNYFWIGGATLCAAVGFEGSLWVILLAAFTAVAVGTAIFAGSATRPGVASDPPPAVPAEDLSAERARVLRLLEEGKINAEECGELLTALAESGRGPAPRPVSPARKLVVAGAALVFIGFLLPWFNINLGQVMKETQDQLSKMMPNALPGSVRVTPNMMPQNIRMVLPEASGGAGADGTIRIQGADVGHNFGWVVLAWAIAAAALPLFAVATPPATRRKYSMLMLLFGSITLLGVISQNTHFVAAGIWLVGAGYVLEWLGVARETPAHHG